MNRDQIKGRIDHAKGHVKEAAGKASGDTQLESEGQVDKAAGKTQSKVGDVKRKIARKIDGA
jgi:uncharacterized protein YjbJ (UPF0337 family)